MVQRIAVDIVEAEIADGDTVRWVVGESFLSVRENMLSNG